MQHGSAAPLARRSVAFPVAPWLVAAGLLGACGGSASSGLAFRADAQHVEPESAALSGPSKATDRCLLDTVADAAYVDDAHVALAARGMSLRLQDNRNARAGEFNGLVDIRLPGHTESLPLHLWNFENVFDGATHQGNGDPLDDILFEPRQERAPIRLASLGPSLALMHQPPTPFWGVEMATLVQLSGTGVIDVEVALRLTRPVPRTPWYGLFWATYPPHRDMPLYVPGRPAAGEAPRWLEIAAPAHLVKNTLTLEGAPHRLEFTRDYPDKLWTTMADAEESWLLPLAWGHVGPDAALVMMFERARHLRITQSPVSAWDAQLVVHDWAVGDCVSLRARFVLGDLRRDDALRAYERWTGTRVPPLLPPVRTRG